MPFSANFFSTTVSCINRSIRQAYGVQIYKTPVFGIKNTQHTQYWIGLQRLLRKQVYSVYIYRVWLSRFHV